MESKSTIWGILLGVIISLVVVYSYTTYKENKNREEFEISAKIIAKENQDNIDEIRRARKQLEEQENN